MQTTANNNGKIHTSMMGADTGGLVGAAQGMLDKVKGPVFWFACGYILCKIMDRKKKKVITA